MKYYKLNTETLDYTPIEYTKFVFSVIGVVLLISFGVVYLIDRYPNVVTRVIPVTINHQNLDFNTENLKKEIERLNIKHSDIVYAQAVLETAEFKSRVFKNNNNLFGMKLAYSRPTTALGMELNHAYYSSWKESVLDYALWQSSFGRRLSRDEYLDLISKIYAEDKSYINKIMKLTNGNKSQRKSSK